jgi:ribosomal protein S1
LAAKKKSSTKKSTETTMDDLLTKYSSQSVSLSRGDKVTGTIVSITPKRVVVDIGGKSEGIVAEKAFREAQSYIKTLKVGDKVEASVIVSETPEGFVILSFRHTMRNTVWEKVKEAKEKLTPITVEGKSVNSAGVVVVVDGLIGFVPKSQLGKDTTGKIQSLVGKKFKAIVIDYDRENKKIVLSEKEVSEKEQLALARRAMKNLREGDIYDGEVITIYDFGCFVEIKATVGKGKVQKTKRKQKVPLEGLVHISELSWEKVEKPGDVVRIGDKIKVKVIGKSSGKLALSVKQIQDDPWKGADKKYKKEKKVKGKVTKLSDFGVFVALEPGLEGLIHTTKIPPGKKLAKGDEVNVYIEEVDVKGRRISLGLVLTQKPVGYK